MGLENDVQLQRSGQTESERLNAVVEQLAAERAERGFTAMPRDFLLMRAVHLIAREDCPEGPEEYNRRNLGALRALGMISIPRNLHYQATPEEPSET